jgi:hypothetical protein
MTTPLQFPARNTRASMPVERLALGTLVSVRLTFGTLDAWYPGIISGRQLLGPALYQIDLGIDGMQLVCVPESRIKTEKGSAA